MISLRRARREQAAHLLGDDVLAWDGLQLHGGGDCWLDGRSGGRSRGRGGGRGGGGHAGRGRRRVERDETRRMWWWSGDDGGEPSGRRRGWEMSAIDAILGTVAQPGETFWLVSSMTTTHHNTGWGAERFTGTLGADEACRVMEIAGYPSTDPCHRTTSLFCPSLNPSFPHPSLPFSLFPFSPSAIDYSERPLFP